MCSAGSDTELAESDLWLDYGMQLPRPWVEDLRLPAATAGAVWLPIAGAPPSRVIYHHRHAELEANLVVAGCGTYLVGSRTCRLDPGSLVWLFPGQDHCLIQRSADFAMLIAVWKPAVAQAAAVTLGEARLAAADPGVICRRLAVRRLREDAEALREPACPTCWPGCGDMARKR